MFCPFSRNVQNDGEITFFVHRTETIVGINLVRALRFGSRVKLNLSLRLDLVAKDKVGGHSKDDEENTQDNEIYIELGILHI